MSDCDWREQFNFQCDDDDEVRFVLYQHVELYFYSASLLKQLSADSHVVLIPSRPVCALSS